MFCTLHERSNNNSTDTNTEEWGQCLRRRLSDEFIARFYPVHVNVKQREVGADP